MAPVRGVPGLVIVGLTLPCQRPVFDHPECGVSICAIVIWHVGLPVLNMRRDGVRMKGAVVAGTGPAPEELCRRGGRESDLLASHHVLAADSAPGRWSEARDGGGEPAISCGVAFAINPVRTVGVGLAGRTARRLVGHVEWVPNPGATGDVDAGLHIVSRNSLSQHQHAKTGAERRLTVALQMSGFGGAAAPSGLDLVTTFPAALRTVSTPSLETLNDPAAARRPASVSSKEELILLSLLIIVLEMAG